MLAQAAQVDLAVDLLQQVQQVLQELAEMHLAVRQVAAVVQQVEPYL